MAMKSVSYDQSDRSLSERDSDERSAKRFWISLVLVLFVIQSTVMGIAINLAISDPSAVVTPDYHAAALNWDETRRSRSAPQRMGWTVKLYVSDVADQRGQRAVEWTAADREGNPLDGLTIDARVYHHARAGDVQELQLKSAGDGRYIALADMPRNGLWQIDLSVAGAEEPVEQTETVEVHSS
ncbi:FixH family protein [Stieleria varia]|uniref:FixH n=1 Tax=Stieleria varia TaxID=2528005 RepID=A0A5C6ASI5_9BACT|nr:FixH family protein [Stieleria varia]TWU02451.1 FixH [Stieleria varia]